MGRAASSGFFSTVGGRDAVSTGPDLSSEQLKAKRNNQERQNRRLGKGEVMGRKGKVDICKQGNVLIASSNRSGSTLGY